MTYTDEQKKQARVLFRQGTPVAEIAEQLSIGKRTVYNWSVKDDWSSLRTEDPQTVIAARIACLAAIDDKSGNQIRELDRLLAHVENMAKIRAGKKRGAASDENGSGRSGKKARNDFSQIDEKDLMAKFKKGMFPYQLDMWNRRNERIRVILKSRQIGMTYYFAREAFTDALLRGHNKIFLSASRKQADQFRKYIRAFSKEWFGIDLKGKDQIILKTKSGDVSLDFLSTNASTAQSYTGDLYVDEFFWIRGFAELKEVALGMSSQSRWNTTFFSTPRTKNSDAYKFWSGDEYNAERKRRNLPIEEFPADKALKKGVVCPDGHWRKVISIEDAIQQGCNLFDLEQLKKTFPEDSFNRLFMCKFQEEAGHCFQYRDLKKCLSDPSLWDFFDPSAARPFSRPVWIGYDPSRRRDGACIAVLAPPEEFGGTFHVLEKITLHNASWEYQANTIKDLCGRYTVEYIGIDVTGPGSGVYEMVTKFFPQAEAINYSLETKTKLVLKAQQIIKDHRILWDESYSDIAAGFMLIRRTATQSGGITYIADRSDETGHADSAWAIMHALIHEDLVASEDEGCCIF